MLPELGAGESGWNVEQRKWTREAAAKKKVQIKRYAGQLELAVLFHGI